MNSLIWKHRSTSFARNLGICRRMFSQNENNKQPRGPITFTSLGITALVAGGMLIYYNIEKEKRSEKVAGQVVTTGKAALGGPWVLVDHDGIPQTDASYRGKFTLLYFGFTYCPDICPNELVKIAKIMNALETKKMEPMLQPLFISVDPSRDTIRQLQHYRKDFHPSLIFLTGTKDQVAKATRAYRVYFSKANENENDSEDYLVDHSIVLYLVSPEGEFLDFFTQRSQVGDIADKIMHHKNTWKPSTTATAAAAL